MRKTVREKRTCYSCRSYIDCGGGMGRCTCKKAEAAQDCSVWPYVECWTPTCKHYHKDPDCELGKDEK